MPAFAEQPAIRTPRSGRYSALAVSADGGTLAVAEYTGLIRLFDLASGAERISFQYGGIYIGWRLGFSPDGKAIALFDQGRSSWFDTASGKPATPKPARIAVQPAGSSDQWAFPFATSSDCSKQIRGNERHPTIVFQTESKTDHGAFIDITDSASGKTWKWRVGKPGCIPSVAISADGTKVAGSVQQEGGEVIMIWAMPK